MATLPRLGLALSLVWAAGLAGCGRPDAAQAPSVEATPSPTPKPPGDTKEFSARNIRHKADQAAVALENFLKDQDPGLRNKVQRLADKVSDKLGKDKEHWREKLEEKRRELQPRIEQLRQQLGQVSGDKNKDKLRDALSQLEGKSQDTDRKISELESAGADAWKQFKARLKEDEAKESNAPPGDATPTPTPRDR